MDLPRHEIQQSLEVSTWRQEYFSRQLFGLLAVDRSKTTLAKHVLDCNIVFLAYDSSFHIGNCPTVVLKDNGYPLDLHWSEWRSFNGHFNPRPLDFPQRLHAIFSGFRLPGHQSEGAKGHHNSNYPCDEQADTRQVLRRKQTTDIAFRVTRGPVILGVGCLLIFYFGLRWRAAMERFGVAFLFTSSVPFGWLSGPGASFFPYTG